MRQKLLLLAAVFFGVLAFMFTFQQINAEKKKIMASAVDVEVIRVVNEMTGGQKIKESDIEKFVTKRYANSPLTGEIPWKQKNHILDLPVRGHIAPNTILNYSHFEDRLASGQTGLTAVVRPGYRAVTIPVDPISSVAGFVRPNNYVDLVGTFRFPDAKGDATLDTVTMTILQQVKVLACGADMGRIGSQMNAAPSRSYSSVTLELTPKEAEMIIFASQKGRISLTLRSYEESDVTTDLQNVNWSYLGKHIDLYNRERSGRMKKRIH